MRCEKKTQNTDFVCRLQHFSLQMRSVRWYHSLGYYTNVICRVAPHTVVRADNIRTNWYLPSVNKQIDRNNNHDGMHGWYVENGPDNNFPPLEFLERANRATTIDQKRRDRRGGGPGQEAALPAALRVRCEGYWYSNKDFGGVPVVTGAILKRVRKERAAACEAEKKAETDAEKTAQKRSRADRVRNRGNRGESDLERALRLSREEAAAAPAAAAAAPEPLV